MMRRPGSAPCTCRNFRVSSISAGSRTRATPQRANSASYKASGPASELVWLMAVCAPSADEPALSATSGTPCAKRLQGHGAERGHVVQAFDVQADGADARVCEQRLHDGLHAVTGLVAHGNQIGQRQAAPLHGQVQADVAALGDDGHPALHPLPAVLVRPQRHAVQVIQHAVAVGPHQRHVTRRSYQFLLEGHACAAHFGKAGGVANRPARAARSQRPHHAHSSGCGHCDKAGVGRFG